MRSAHRFIRISGGVFMIFASLLTTFYTTINVNAQTVGVPATLSYNGRLFNSSGTALSGTYYFWVDLESALSGGSALQSNIQAFADADGDGVVDAGETAITVTNGYFTFEIPIGAGVANFANNIYLEIKVHTADASGSAETLSPRVRVGKTPYSIFAQAIENSASAPAAAFDGRMYYDTVDDQLFVRRNGAWVALSSSLDDAYSVGSGERTLAIDDGDLSFDLSGTSNLVFDTTTGTGDILIQDAGSTWFTFSDGQALTSSGSGAITLSSTAGSVSLSASDTGNLGTTNVVIRAGDSAPDAGENGNDVAIEAEDDVLVNASGDFVLTANAITINGAEFQVSGTTGSITINDDADAGQISIEGTILDINSLDFVGAGLITTTGNTALTLDSGGAAAINIGSADVTQINFTTDNASATDINITGSVTVSTDLIVGNDFSGSGDFDWVLDADNGASITTATNAGTVDALTIVAQPNFDANTDALAIALTPEADGANAIHMTNNAIDIAAIVGTNEAGDRVNAINIGGLSNAPGNLDTAINIASGYDFDINAANVLEIAISNSMELILNATSLFPAINDGTALGTAFNRWSDLFLDYGAVINFNNENYTLTHSAGQLATNEDFRVGDDFSVEGVIDIGTAEVFITDDTTPSVSSGSWFLTPATGSVTVTNFDVGTSGQTIIIESQNATTFDCTANPNFSCGGADIVTADGDMTMWLLNGSVWSLVSHVDISATQTGADLAEWFPATEEVQPGDVLVASGTPVHVQASSRAYQKGLMGIVATHPGLILGERGESTFATLVALAGRVPVNVSDENGAIEVGDYLTSSASRPGYAMKATQAGPVIGMALESFSSGVGQITVKVDSMWYTPVTDLQGGSSDDLLMVETFTVSDAVFTGSVTVEQHLYGSADMAGRVRMESGDTRVVVTFDTPYRHLPIVTFSSRSNSPDALGAWVSEESLTGFVLNRPEASSSASVEFNWIAMGVEELRVTIATLPEVIIEVLE